MQLPIAIPGLRHVNMYCFRDAAGATVMDPGLPDDASWVAVKERLRQAELDVRHVHTVIITHSHPDHSGGAARFYEERGARVIAREDFSLFGERPQLAEPEVSVEHLEPRPIVVRSPSELRAAPSGMRIPWVGDAPSMEDRDRKQWEGIRSSARRA